MLEDLAIMLEDLAIMLCPSAPGYMLTLCSMVMWPHGSLLEKLLLFSHCQLHELS